MLEKQNTVLMERLQLGGFPEMLRLFKLHENDGGFLVNGQLMIIAELDVFEIIGTHQMIMLLSLMIHSRKLHL